MAVINRDSDQDKLREVDKDVKNRFQWNWLETEVSVIIKSSERKVRLSDFIRKIDVPGKVFCVYCNDNICYGKRGVRSLIDHVKTKKHLGNTEIRISNYVLASNTGEKSTESETSLPYGTDPVLQRYIAPGENVFASSSIKRLVPIAERVLNQQATVLGVIAEQNFPLGAAPVLINLAKELSTDHKALSMLTMDRTSASYKMIFGLAQTFQEKTKEMLDNAYFSLNIDESTSDNVMRVLTVLVSFFHPVKQEVVIQHLSSVSLRKVDSESVFRAVTRIFDSMKLKWSHLVSVLLDSCAVMRGPKQGLEARIRSVAHHLVDVDGDTVHHIHNGIKKFTEPFGKHIETLFIALYNDFHWSVELQSILQEVCDTLKVKFHIPSRFLPHRWLLCYDLSVSTIALLDALTVFYHSFLGKTDKKTYDYLVACVYKRRNCSEDDKSKLKTIQGSLMKKKMTAEGKERKLKILDRLFFKREKTKLVLNFYVAVLPVFKKYVKLFQSEQPLIHELHPKQVEVLYEFLSYFLKPEYLNTLTTVNIRNINFSVKENWLPLKNIFIGDGTQKIIDCVSQKSQSRKQYTVTEFFDSMQKAYLHCAAYLVLKLPLNNTFLQCAAALSPNVRGETGTLKKLLKMPELLNNVISSNELDQYNKEVRSFQIDRTLPKFDKNHRIDHWWSSVNNDEYPMLVKVAKAVLSCFHGPLVEASFSSMNDIIDKKTNRLKIETYSALQTVRYNLRSQGKSATQFFKRKDILHDPVNPSLVKNMRRSSKSYRESIQKRKKYCQLVLNLYIQLQCLLQCLLQYPLLKETLEGKKHQYRRYRHFSRPSRDIG